MIHQEYGPRRSRATRKPSVTCPETTFYRCPRCGRLFQELDRREEGEEPCCCGGAMERLEPVVPEDLPDGVSLDYRIVGGYNDNAVQFFWRDATQENRLEWVYLRTFTGGCIKYPPEKKRPPIIFPLADGVRLSLQAGLHPVCVPVRRGAGGASHRPDGPLLAD